MQVRWSLVFIFLLTIASLLIALPKFSYPYEFKLLGKQIKVTVSSPYLQFQIGNKVVNRDFTIRKGLDLQGGTQLVFEADMTNISAADQVTALESVKEVISRRIDLYGIVEPVIQTSKVGDKHRILVEMPGIESVSQAVELIGQTAQLDFRQVPESELAGTPSAVPIFLYEPTGLTGKDLKRALVQFNSQSGVNAGPSVALEFSDEGKDKFKAITERNLNLPVAIFLDEYPVTAPVVQQVINNGQAVISGSFDIEAAKQLAIQLNAGALPVPIEIIEQRNIGPSLGEESIEKSIIAGVVGLMIVMAFMVAYYGKVGLLADIALIIYGLITLAIYKLIPITLTLPGIAGFILSVGMAVDANILIFERMKEETRQGRKWKVAMELGFGKAWDSIKDANFATIITALILLNPLNLEWLVTSGMVRGFALTLFIGVLISMFTGVVVTRTLMRVFYKGKDNS